LLASYSKVLFNQSSKIEAQRDLDAHLIAEILDNYFNWVPPALGRSHSLINEDKEA
jgi:hypothetical protein